MLDDLALVVLPKVGGLADDGPAITDAIDILPALKGEDSRLPLGYCGLRCDLFLWGYSPRRFIEQAYRWLCQTAVTPIL